MQWVATGYTLALCAVIPVAAWAMSRFGAKRSYVTALALFTGGSAVASLSWNIETLVLFRVVQGFGGGLLVPVLSPGLALLIYGLSIGGVHGDFTMPGALLPAVAGLLLIAGFVARGLTARHPLLQLRLFRDRTFAAGTATMVLFPAGYFGSMLLTPMYYQTTRGLTATESGLLGAPLAVAAGTSMQIATRRIDRASPR